MRSRIDFYLTGRADIEESGFEAEIDIGSIAAAVIAAGTGASLIEKTREAAANVMRKSESSSERRAWCDSMADEIDDSGGDREAAWRQFQEGRIDALRLQIEEPVIEEIEALLDSEDDEPPGNGTNDDTESDEDLGLLDDEDD